MTRHAPSAEQILKLAKALSVDGGELFSEFTLPTLKRIEAVGRRHQLRRIKQLPISCDGAAVLSTAALGPQSARRRRSWMATFRRVRGWRAWVAGAGTLIGLTGGIATTWQLTVQFLPAPLAKYAPLLMMIGFAAALAALGTIPDTEVDGVLYRVYTQLRQKSADQETKVTTIEAQFRDEVEALRSDNAVLRSDNAALRSDMLTQFEEVRRTLDQVKRMTANNARVSPTLSNRTRTLATEIWSAFFDYTMSSTTKALEASNSENGVPLNYILRGRWIASRAKEIRERENIEAAELFEAKFAEPVKQILTELAQAGIVVDVPSAHDDIANILNLAHVALPQAADQLDEKNGPQKTA